VNPGLAPNRCGAFFFGIIGAEHESPEFRFLAFVTSLLAASPEPG